MINRKKVLVVDDEERVLNFVKIGLSHLGYEVVVTTSGEESLLLAESEKPDIMILDIVMSPLTGFDVLKKLRTFSVLPVVICSSLQNISNLAREVGADGFIAKPFTTDKLAQKIVEIMEPQTVQYSTGI